MLGPFSRLSRALRSHKTLQRAAKRAARRRDVAWFSTAFECEVRQCSDGGLPPPREYLQPFDAGADLRQQQSREHTKRQGVRAAPHGWTVLTGHEYREQSGYLGLWLNSQLS